VKLNVKYAKVISFSEVWGLQAFNWALRLDPFPYQQILYPPLSVSNCMDHLSRMGCTLPTPIHILTHLDIIFIYSL